MVGGGPPPYRDHLYCALFKVFTHYGGEICCGLSAKMAQEKKRSLLALVRLSSGNQTLSSGQVFKLDGQNIGRFSARQCASA